MRTLLILITLLFCNLAHAAELVPLYRYLDTVGNGTGTKNAVGNYAVTPQIFKIVCPSGKGYTINSMTVHVSGTSNFALMGYGNIAAGLTNGLSIQISLNGVLMDILDGVPIKTNDDFNHISATINHITYTGSGDSIAAQFYVTDFGIPLTLNPGDYLQITLHDDFSTLATQHFIAKGYSN